MKWFIRICVSLLLLGALVVGGAIGFTEYWLWKTGEAHMKGRFLAAQNGGPEMYANAQLFNTTNLLKFQGLVHADADVIVVGSSRVNQFRAGMFEPYTFYNMGNITTSLPQTVAIVEALPEDRRPSVIINMIDPLMLRADRDYVPVQASDWGQWPLKRPEIWRDAWRAWKTSDEVFDWYKMEGAGAPYLGGRAIKSGRGTRGSDGSVYWGRHHERNAKQQDNALQNYSDRVERIMDAKTMFDGFEDGVSEHNFQGIADYVAQMDALGVTVIAITPVLSEAVNARMDRDPVRYKLWHDMNDPAFAAQMNEILPYFNFARASAFDGDPAMVMDAIHPSEPAAALMWVKMLEDPRVAALFKDVDANAIKAKVAAADSPVAVIYD